MAAWQSTIINYIILSGEALLSDENSGKLLGGQGSAPNPAGWAHSAPQTPVAGGEVIASPHQEPFFFFFFFFHSIAQLQYIKDSRAGNEVNVTIGEQCKNRAAGAERIG